MGDSTLAFWMQRYQYLEGIYRGLEPDVRAQIHKRVDNELQGLQALMAAETREGNGLEKVVGRERAAALLEEAARRLTTQPARIIKPYTENADGRHPGMVWIPPKRAAIGVRKGFFSREEPERLALIPGFWIDICSVTNAQYHALFPRHVRDPRAPDDDMPVVGVNWYEAQRYATAIGKRLPTPEQWEAAARGPESWLYSSGNEFDHNAINVWPSAGPVGVRAYPANPSGLFQMSGNISEWTSEVIVHELASGGQVLFNLVRGGAWRNCAAGARTTLGLCLDLAERTDVVGFRCVCNV
jgi:formylglycine-generating enzyme required for sulfatase activity